MTRESSRFLYESNAIEQEYSVTAFADAEDAWELAQHAFPLNENKLLSLHYALLKNIARPIAGKLRQCDVFVGGRKCPGYEFVPELLEIWFADHGDASSEKQIKEAHIAFERIHPFEDGNGRIGRIIMNAQRVRVGLPILVIHEGEEQQEYYKWFG